MTDRIAELTPTGLADLLEKVDQVCEQAQTLRVEIVNAMTRQRLADQSVAASRPLRKSIRKRTRAR